VEAPLLPGVKAPDFELPDLDGNLIRLSSHVGRVVVLNFWSAECPWSERSDHRVQPYWLMWGERVTWLAIASNANEPTDLLRQVAAERAIPHLLHDRDQQIADLYGAQTTPHLFVIDATGILRYQGAFDDRTFRQHTPTRTYLVEAVEALLAGQMPNPPHTPAYGCTIVRYLSEP
jgi:peroxiredoxin